MVESFFATLKRELRLKERRWSATELGTRILDYIEGYDNTRRRHSGLGYLSPVAYAKSVAQSG